MTSIGGQCEGCSRASWKSKNRSEATESYASSAAEGESLPEENSSPDAGSAEPDISNTDTSAFDDPARALKDAVHRLAGIETKLGTPALSAVGVATVTTSPVVAEHSPGSQASHDALRKEQQMLKARVNAIFRCIGLWESHEKVLHEVEDIIWGWHQRLEEALPGPCYFRSLPYYQLLLKLKYKLPGIADLLRFMDEIYSDSVSSLITIYEIPSTTNAPLVRHDFKMNDPTQLLSHWDILHDSNPMGDSGRSVLLVDGLDSAAVEILGHALEIHPLVFARHLWRNSGRDITDCNWEAPALSQAPLCSLPDQPTRKIALDVEACMSLESLSGTDLHGLEDLRSIETVGELLDIQERNLRGREAVSEKRGMAMTLDGLKTQCGLANCSGISVESTRLEQPLARCVDQGIPLRYTSTILSALELCASATICTLPSRTQQLSSKTLMLRTPSRWHKSRSIDTEGARTWNDPFRIETPMQLDGAESGNSVYNALWTMRKLEAAAKTCLTQTEVSTLVSLSLLKAAISTVWNMTVSDHQILVNPGKSFMLKKNTIRELVEVSDECSAYLNDRCQRQRSAVVLLSAVLEKIHLAVTDSTSAALSRYVAEESKTLQEAKRKIESQLQRTEDLLTVRIDRSFKDLQIELAQTQLEESRKAIKQADTVARLTILAFVFIPVGAVCGFFGMNIVEVAANGGFSFWVFGTTMGAVLAMTLLLAFGDSIYALWNYYAQKVDSEMWGGWYYPLTNAIPYPFRWASLKIKAKMKVGQEWRQQTAMETKEEIERRAEV